MIKHANTGGSMTDMTIEAGVMVYGMLTADGMVTGGVVNG